MRTADGLRSEVLTAALNEAVAGKPDRLYTQLSLQSGLPGTRANMTIANAFATECAQRGKPADRLIFEMATIHPDVAKGATEHEFIPLCGVLAIGARASRDPALRKRAILTLHEASEDPRYRVRDVVPVALARIGEHMGDELVAQCAAWTDGFFQAAAVLLALTDTSWLSATNDGEAVLARLDEAFLLIKNAPRSASRYPGFKALLDALALSPAAVATRYGVAVFDMLERWSKVEMPELRTIIEGNLKSSKVTGRYALEIARVRTALDQSAPVPRDPTILIQGMRSRGKKHNRR